MVAFSKKPAFAMAASAPSTGGFAGKLRKIAANRFAAPAVAGSMLLLGVSGILFMGNPQAGAPSVRVALGPHSAHAEPGALRGEHAGDPVTTVGEIGPNGEFLPPFMEVEGSAAEMTGPSEVTVGVPTGGHAQGQASPAMGLPPAPIAGLSQPGPGGLLPIIAADGRLPSMVYARPFRTNGKPRVGLVIGGLGINPVTTRQAIEQLPPEITLSFAPCADQACASGLQGWIDLARSRGHEVMLEAPMEPTTYPQDDPGPYTLMANARPEDTTRKLETLLSRATGYFGLTNYMGSRFVATGPGMQAFTETLKKRGLAFIDDGQASSRGGGLPRATAERVIDDQPGPDAINRQLAMVEAAATQKGQALGVGLSWAVTVRQVSAWAKGLDSRGYQLAPASALTVRR